MTSIRHILVPTDFGEAAQRAVACAIDLAREFDAKVTLLHVYEEPILPYAIGIYLPTEALHEAAKKAIHESAAEGRACWPNVDAFLAEGTAAEQVLRVAKHLEVDLIVMGTQGHRGFVRAMLGSVAETVVRLSPVPVLTLHAASKKDVVAGLHEVPEAASADAEPSRNTSSQGDEALKVSAIMSRKVIAIDAASSVGDASALLVARGISGMPVLDAGRVVGVVSKTDLVRVRHEDLAVRNVMTPLLRFVRPQHPAHAAVDIMLASKVHRVLVLDDDGCVAGIVTAADVLRAQRSGALGLPQSGQAEAALAIPDDGGF